MINADEQTAVCRPRIDDVVVVLEDLNECLNGTPDASMIMRNASLKRVAKGGYTAGFAAPPSLVRQSAAAPPAVSLPHGQPAHGTASSILIDMIRSSGLDRDRDLRKRLDQTGAEELIRIAGLQPGQTIGSTGGGAAARGGGGAPRAPARVAGGPGWTPDIQLVPKDFRERMAALDSAAPEKRTPEQDGLRNAYTETLKVMNKRMHAVRGGAAHR